MVELMVPTVITKSELIPASKETRELDEGVSLELSQWRLEDLLSKDRLERLDERFPMLEREVDIATFRIPAEAKPIFALHPRFNPIIDLVKQGKDVGGIFQSGASGAQIKENKTFEDMPSRQEEYEVLRHKGIYGNFFQFQVGGWPFNLGSLFMERQADGLFVTSQDLVVPVAYRDEDYKPALYGQKSPFCGFAVMESGDTQFLEVDLDVSSQAFLQASAEMSLEGVQSYIATQPALVKEGRAVALREIYGASKMSDIRHWVGLPYVKDLVDSQGQVVSGSFLMGALNRKNIEDHGEEILQAIERNQEVYVSTKIDLVSQQLADAIRANWGLEKIKSQFSVFGFNEDLLERVIRGEDVSFKPTEAVYPHLFWGRFIDGSWGVSVTSGLLRGTVSGQSGIPSTVIPKVLESVGYETALFGSQGKDTGQVYSNGDNVILKHLYGEEYERLYSATVEAKSATTPSIALHWTRQGLGV